ncbi:DUF6917 domain-containing protein [Pseudothermotoga sp. U03pept]|uniref:DUF6917 domain-containing protein n=1 Tax=Pseudothermotoga sp. U03pept TaxID=3447012 RepID=UPI003F0C4659
MTDPYAAGMVKNDPYAKKSTVVGRVVAVLRGKVQNRNLSLISPWSRALRNGEIHELLLTNEKEAAPGKNVNTVAYLAFVEIVNPGVIVFKDKVKLSSGKCLGTLAGFDETHMPNHQNIVILTDDLITGEEMNLNLNDLIYFTRD